MNNVFVYCEIEGTNVQEVSQELLTKGRKLANELGVELHAIAAGSGIKGKVEDQILPYGVDKLFVFDAEGLFPYTSAPHTDVDSVLCALEDPVAPPIPSRPVRPPRRIILSPGSEVSLCTARLGAAPMTAPISIRFAT